MQGLGGRVLVIGCGGLGGYVAEELARLNVDYLILVDGDYYTESNMNRQIGALFSTLGKNKAEVMLSRVRDISKTHVKSVPNDFTRYNAYLIDEVDIVDGQAGLLHGLTGSGHGADAHDLRVDAALAPADELGHGLEVVLGNRLAGSENDSGSAVVDAGSIGRRHRAAGTGRRSGRSDC